MPTAASLAKKAEQCLANANEVPGAPLWLLGKAAAFGARGDFDKIQKADNRFYLKMFLAPLQEQKLQIRWRVDSVYDFEPFERKDYVTRLPIGEWVLNLPDGLSQYMTVLGVAKAFDYYAEWHETWSL